MTEVWYVDVHDILHRGRLVERHMRFVKEPEQARRWVMEVDEIDALLGLLEHYGVIELVRSGAVAVTRGPKALAEKVIGSEITGR